MPAAFTFIADGNISPSRFVMRKQGGTQLVVQADGTAPINGISQEGPRRSPGTDSDDTYAAVAGEYLKVYSDDDQDCPLLLLGGTVSGGDPLISDGSGKGLVYDATDTDPQFIGAYALQNGVADTLIRVRFDRQISGEMA